MEIGIGMILDTFVVSLFGALGDTFMNLGTLGACLKFHFSSGMFGGGLELRTRTSKTLKYFFPGVENTYLRYATIRLTPPHS